jgi:DNA-binding XRE family transcriptional regulator
MEIRRSRLQGVRMPPRSRTRAKPRPNSIASYRMAAGLTQGELALKARTSKETIYRLETGGIMLTQLWAEKIAPHLGCDPTDLVRHEDPIPALQSLGLPTRQTDIARPMQMLNAIGELVRSGAYLDAASSCRTLAKLLVEITRQQAASRAED